MYTPASEEVAVATMYSLPIPTVLPSNTHYILEEGGLEEGGGEKGEG